jgi:hypothetical protein
MRPGKELLEREQNPTKQKVPNKERSSKLI